MSHAETGTGIVPYGEANVATLDARSADMQQQIATMQRFIEGQMVEGHDFGRIPGAKKPSLLKPGAEKLLELYGYAPIVGEVVETMNEETGFYRARVTMRVVTRHGQILIGEGTGECNTKEGNYRVRHVPEWKFTGDRERTPYEVRSNDRGDYRMFIVENDDPWTLWNTVLKMAKKRALIDATLSSTRSSGLFTQDVEDLRANGYYADEDDRPSQTSGRQQRPSGNGNGSRSRSSAPAPSGRQDGKPRAAGALSKFWTSIRQELGLSREWVLSATSQEVLADMDAVELGDLVAGICRMAGTSQPGTLPAHELQELALQTAAFIAEMRHSTPDEPPAIEGDIVDDPPSSADDPGDYEADVREATRGDR